MVMMMVMVVVRVDRPGEQRTLDWAPRWTQVMEELEGRQHHSGACRPNPQSTGALMSSRRVQTTGKSECSRCALMWRVGARQGHWEKYGSDRNGKVEHSLFVDRSCRIWRRSRSVDDECGDQE